MSAHPLDAPVVPGGIDEGPLVDLATIDPTWANVLDEIRRTKRLLTRPATGQEGTPR